MNKNERSASKILMPSLDDLFKSSDLPADGEHIVTVDLNKIRPYHDHIFKVTDDDAMQKLENSIREEGVLVPAIVRIDVNGGYEMISGHRRMRACERAGIDSMPVIVRDMNDEEATLYMIESNIQREKQLPSELAWSLKKESEIRFHNGLKADENTSDAVAKMFGMSPRKVQRIIRLTLLSKELVNYVDQGKIGTTVAESLSYISINNQKTLVKVIDEYNKFPNLRQAESLKLIGCIDNMTEAEMIRILADEDKPIRMRLSSSINAFFDKYTTEEEKQDIICQALKEYFERRGADGE